MAAEEPDKKFSPNKVGDVFWGDLGRRRPTKRQTTVRSFSVVRNWKVQDTDELERSSRKGIESFENTHAMLRVHGSNTSCEPLSIQDVQSVSTENNVEDLSPLKTPSKSQSTLETSLPGAALITPNNRLKRKLTDISSRDEDNEDEEMENEDNNVVVQVHEETPEKIMSIPQAGLNSGPQPRQTPKTSQKRTVAFKLDNKSNISDDFNDEEYEANNFVRLFDADLGRRRSAAEVTDLDIILTNVEEIALEIKNEVDSSFCKKVIREMFIRLRKRFSDSIDIYKEKKYLQSATTKANSKIGKMKQELIRVQAKRKRIRTKLEKLQSEHEQLEKQKKGKEEAYTFVTEFENLQRNLRRAEIGPNEEVHNFSDDSLSSLLSEACGYLSTHRQLKDMNDKLQCWVDSNRHLNT